MKSWLPSRDFFEGAIMVAVFSAVINGVLNYSLAQERERQKPAEAQERGPLTVPKLTSHAPEELSEHTMELAGGRVWRYRFAAPKDSFDDFDTGDRVPHRWQEVVRCAAVRVFDVVRDREDLGPPVYMDGECKTVGYAEIHLHRVKHDESDVEDLSFGATFRTNPKVGQELEGRQKK
jgi:hypothetical protein